MKALIIDDEPMPAKHLQGMIQRHCFEITSIHLISSPVDAIAHLSENEYDLIFLDVEMPEIDGFELLEEVQLPLTTSVIFTTAYSKYALDAFKANAAHYILKPATKDDLLAAVRKAFRLLQLASPPDTPAQTTPIDPVISVYSGEEHHILKSSDIVRLEADRSYTMVILADRKMLSSKGIGHYEQKLGNSSFFRCHNSHLVNLHEVVKLGKGRGGYLVLSNDDVVPVAATKKAELEKRLGI